MENVKIKIIGIGGAGCNAIEALRQEFLGNTSFLAVNTDVQALDKSSTKDKVVLGHKKLRGLSAGGDVKLARKMAEFDKDILLKAMEGLVNLYCYRAWRRYGDRCSSLYCPAC